MVHPELCILRSGLGLRSAIAASSISVSIFTCRYSELLFYSANAQPAEQNSSPRSSLRTSPHYQPIAALKLIANYHALQCSSIAKHLEKSLGNGSSQLLPLTLPIPSWQQFSSCAAGSTTHSISLFAVYVDSCWCNS